MLRNEKGTQDIGFILIFVISSMVLTLLTWMMATLVERSTDQNVEAQVKAIGTKLSSSIEEVIYVARVTPEANYTVNFPLPKQIGSAEYRVLIGSFIGEGGDTHPAVFINTTDSKIRQVHFFQQTSDIKVEGRASSESGSITISYLPDEKRILLRSK